MLQALVPVAALLAQTSAKVEVQPDCSANTPAAHAKDIAQPASSSSPWIVDGSTKP